MRGRTVWIAGTVVAVIAAVASLAALHSRAVGRKASDVRAGMAFADVSRVLDGWAVINAHPVGRGTQQRARPGPEYFGYSGEVYVLTPVEPDGRETDRRKMSRGEFERRVATMLATGEPWFVYFNFRTIGPDTGVLVRFDGSGRVAAGAREPAPDASPSVRLVQPPGIPAE